MWVRHKHVIQAEQFIAGQQIQTLEPEVHAGEANYSEDGQLLTLAHFVVSPGEWIVREPDMQWSSYSDEAFRAEFEEVN